MDKFLLKMIYAVLKGWLYKTGADAEQMNRIVATKLIMDRRRVNFNWKQKAQKEDTNHMLRVQFMYALFGFFVGMVLLAIPNFIFSYIIFHAYILFMMAMTLITDFSSIMLDTTDTQIIGPRPVSSRTLFMARLVHILIYIFQLTLALTIIPLGIIFFKMGVLVGLSAILTLLLTVLLAVFFTYLLYLLLIRVTSEQKVKDVITYFQIFMTIFFALGYQLLPRFVNFVDLDSSFTLHWYSWLLPPVWMAMTLDAVYQQLFDPTHLMMIGLAIFVPVFFFWVLTKYLAPYFAKKLAATGQDNTAPVVMAANDGRKKGKPYAAIWSEWVCVNIQERAAFLATWRITARDKSFKLKAYPSLAYIIIFIFIFAFRSGKPVAEYWQELPTTRTFLWFIYMPVISVGSLLTLATYSEQYMASWIYYASPLKTPGLLISGALKSLIVKFFVPIYLLLFAFSYYVWGFAIVDDFVLGLVNNICLFFLFARFQSHFLPFSKEPNAKEQSGRFITVMVQLLLVAVLTGLHYLAAAYLNWIIYVMIIPVALSTWALMRYFKKMKWSEVVV